MSPVHSAKVGIILVLVALVAVLAPGAAFAYPEGVSGHECIDCHSFSEDELLDPEASALRRKGPHGAYDTSTSRCQTCHSIHDAPEGGTKLLPAETIKSVCESCHDGTGGSAVYGAIKARTNEEPASAHRVDTTDMVPGGHETGGDLARVFSGPDNTLTCTDCHSVHDAFTVAPFTGDRVRSSVASDTASDLATNRLLRRSPGGAEKAVDVYGAGWCATCHEGRMRQHSEDSGIMQDHPVATDDTYHYEELPVVAAPGSIETELGSLGRSNRGYVMPGPTLDQPTLKTELQEGRGPICQQCHEDARDIGPSARRTNPTLAAEQEFDVTGAYGGAVEDNPRFTVFPHESNNPNFLVSAPDPDGQAALCLRCHSLIHDAASGSNGFVEIFGPGEHDDAMTEFEVEVECSYCHTSDLLATHGDRCESCHTGKYDALEVWAGGCSQGGCHTVYHERSAVAHEPWADTTQRLDECVLCHDANFSEPVHQGSCGNCHARYRDTDTVLPVTSADALPAYSGPALIRFSITKEILGMEKVAIGTTYYRINGGEILTGRSVLITEPGAHTVEFWSIDQNGNEEAAPKQVSFTVSADSTPPVTTTDVVDGQTYYSSVSVTLNATDSSTLGVKTTYYQLDGGPVQTIQPGTTFTVPATDGVVAHTLKYWSEDWSGNVEAQKTVSFTIASGHGTLTLMWNLNGDPPPAGAWAKWTVFTSDSYSESSKFGEGEGGGAGWTGIDDILLPVRATAYYVRVDWGYPGLPHESDSTDVSPPVSILVPGAHEIRGY